MLPKLFTRFTLSHSTASIYQGQNPYIAFMVLKLIAAFQKSDFVSPSNALQYFFILAVQPINTTISNEITCRVGLIQTPLTSGEELP